MNITSAQFRSIKSDALNLIGDIRDAQKKFASIMDRADKAGLLTKRADGQSDMSLLGQVAAHASEEELTIMREENIKEVQSCIDGGRGANQPRSSVGRFFNKIGNIVG